VLWDIFARVYGQQKKPQIFTSKFLPKRHLVKRVDGQRTVMDYLDIVGSPAEATVIFNHLVDQKSIEAVVVCKDQTEAKKIATYANSVPRNMSYAITHDCYRFFPPTKNTSYRSYYIDPTRSRMLDANMSSKVEEKEEDLRKAKSVISEIQVKTDKLKRKEAEVRIKHDQTRDKISGMRQELQKTSSEKSQLKAEEEGLDNFEALKSQLMKKQKDMDKVLEDHKATVSERDQITNQIKEKSKIFNQKTKHVSELRATSNPIEREISKIEGQISSKKKEVTNLEKVVKAYQKAIQDFKKELKDNEVEAKKYRKAAEQRTKGEVLNPKQSVIQLNAKIKQLRELKKKQGTQEALREKEIVLEEFRKKKEQYETQKEKMTSLEQMVSDMEGMNERRSANYLFIRKTISNIISRRFALESEIFSSQYGNTISIDINHQRRELNFIFRNPG
jgi:chromosome segregation ATPase